MSSSTRMALPILLFLVVAANDVGALSTQGTISSPVVWTLSDSPVEVTGHLTVAPSGTLVIDPGVTVRLSAGVDLMVGGALIAQGTADAPIVFTSYKDGVSTPARGDWGGLYFLDSSDDSRCRLEHVVVRYGHFVRLINARPSFRNVAFLNNRDIAVYQYESSMIQEGDGLTASGNLIDAIALHGDITGPIVWSVKSMPYVIPQGFRVFVNNGASLEIGPGVVVKIERSNNVVALEGRQGASIRWKGTESEPIVFTSLRDDTVMGDMRPGDGPPARGDWSFVQVDGPEVNEVENAVFKYGGRSGISSFYLIGDASRAYKSVFTEAAGAGVSMGGASRLLECEAMRNGQDGVRVFGNSFPSLSRVTLADNASAGLLSEGTGAVEIHQSIIRGNGSFGVRNAGSGAVNAQDNWWNHLSGPRHPLNPTGSGDAVSNAVLFNPWKISLDSTPPVTLLDVGAPRSAAGGRLYVTPETLLSFSADDDSSGPVTTEYRVDGGAFAAFTAPFGLPVEGERLLEFRSLDQAGNLENLRSATLFVDATGPSLAPLVSPAPNAAGWHNSDVSVSWEGQDAGAGLAECSAPSVVTSTGAGQVMSGSCADSLGHVSTASVTLNVDKVPPAVRLLSPLNGDTVSGPVTVRSSVTDDTEVSRRELFVDGMVRFTEAGDFIWDAGAESPGPHVLTLRAWDPAGNAGEHTVSITVPLALPSDPPVAEISFPVPLHQGVGRVYSPFVLPVEGTAAGGLERWSLSVAFASDGGTPAAGAYLQIASSTSPVTSGTLGAWNAAGRSGWQTLRLEASGGGDSALAQVNLFIGFPKLVSILDDRHGSGVRDPRGLAVDGNGNLYVAQAGSRGIRKYGPAGNFLALLGRDLGLKDPWGLAIDGEMNILVADRANHRVMKLDPNGRRLWTVGKRRYDRYVEGERAGEFDGPTGVAVDGGGNVYVADRGNGRVQKFDAVGGFLSVYDLDKSAPLPLHKWHRGHGHRHDDDDPWRRRGRDTRPWGVAVDAEGRLYVTDDRHDRLMVLSSSGSLLDAEGLSEPRGLTLSSGGDVYVADMGGRRVVRFDARLRRLMDFGSDWRTPQRLILPTVVALTPSGRLFATDSARGSVLGFDSPEVGGGSAALGLSAALDAEAEVPFELKEVYAYPNPARGGRHPVIHAEGTGAEGLTVKIFDAAGTAVHEARLPADPLTLDDGTVTRTAYEYVWDSAGVPPGVYVCVLEASRGAERLRKIYKLALIK